MRGTKYLWTVVLLGQLLGLLSVCYCKSYSSCPTPTNHQGLCMLVTECPELYAILKNRPLTPENADMLRRSHCGFEGSTPKLCCPQKQIAKSVGTVESLNLTDVSPVTSDLLPEICGDTLENKILGGKPAGLEEFPWMVLLEYLKENGRRTFHCGGVLISKRYVLTAAHCLVGKSLPKTWKLDSVRVGELDIANETDCEDRGFKVVCAKPVVDIPIEEKIAHEHFIPTDSNQYHDIALLRLSRDVEFSSFVKPICLPGTTTQRSWNLIGKNLVVAGWGATEHNRASKKLLKVSVPVRVNQECNRNKMNLSVAQLCAGGEGGRDSCLGDSGGPLMHYGPDANGDVSWFCMGIVSFGYSPCGNEGYSGVYTKVSSYMPWIVSKLRK